MAKRAAAIKAVPSETPSPIEAVTPAGDPYAQRRQALLQQIDVAKKSLERESQSGFGDRSTKAAAYLEKLNTQLQQLDKEARAASPGQQAFHFAMNVGAIPAGMVIGGHSRRRSKPPS
jgi:hypothetical protein